MSLSKLQKYIILCGLESKNRTVAKKVLLDFYQRQKVKPKTEAQIGIITKSVERLIARKLARGYGIKTAEKWFMEKVSLTAPGVKKAKQILNRQQSLPLKIKKIKKYDRRKL